MVIAGSYDQDQGGWGAFQEWPQVSNVLCSAMLCYHGNIQVASCALYAKYAARVESLESIPFHIEKVSRTVL